MQDDYLSLIVAKSAQRAPEVQFCRVVPVRRIEPGRARVEGRVPPLNLGFVQNNIAYAGEQISLLSSAWRKLPSSIILRNTC